MIFLYGIRTSSLKKLQKQTFEMKAHLDLSASEEWVVEGHRGVDRVLERKSELC